MSEKKMYVECRNDYWIFSIKPLKQYTGKPDQPTSNFGKNTEFAQKLSAIYEQISNPLTMHCPICGNPLFISLNVKTGKPSSVTCVQKSCIYHANYQQYLIDKEK